MARLEINAGDVFNKLTVICEVDRTRLPSGQVNRVILCRCDCGNEKEIRLLHLVRGRIKSCGCLIRTRNGEGSTRLCKIWKAMRYRCAPDYFEKHLYHGKGITVCDEWQNSWETFKKWANKNGYSRELQIDRINNSKGYYPLNCRWTTSEVNGNNRDVTIMVNYNGETRALNLVLKDLGIKDRYHTIRSRTTRGWSAQRAIDTPIKKGNYTRKSVD